MTSRPFGRERLKTSAHAGSADTNLGDQFTLGRQALSRPEFPAHDEISNMANDELVGHDLRGGSQVATRSEFCGHTTLSRATLQPLPQPVNRFAALTEIRTKDALKRILVEARKLLVIPLWNRFGCVVDELLRRGGPLGLLSSAGAAKANELLIRPRPRPAGRALPHVGHRRGIDRACRCSPIRGGHRSAPRQSAHRSAQRREAASGRRSPPSR